MPTSPSIHLEFHYNYNESTDASQLPITLFDAYHGTLFGFAPNRVSWMLQRFGNAPNLGVYFQNSDVWDFNRQMEKAAGAALDNDQPNRNGYGYEIGTIDAFRAGEINGYSVDRTWFMTALDGTSYIYADPAGKNTLKMNHANEAFRQWALGQVLKVMRDVVPQSDLVFLDNFNPTIGNNMGDLVETIEFGEGDSPEAIAAQLDWGIWLTTELRNRGYRVMGNIQGLDAALINPMADTLDIVWDEHSYVGHNGTGISADDWFKVFAFHQYCESRGIGYWPVGQINFDQLENNNSTALANEGFFIASCLLAAGTNTNIKVHDNYANAYLPDMTAFNALGLPIGNAVINANGTVQRAFDNGSLVVDPITRTFNMTITSPTYNPTVQPPKVASIPDQTNTIFDDVDIPILTESVDGGTIGIAWTLPPGLNVVDGRMVGTLLPDGAASTYSFPCQLAITNTTANGSKQAIYDFTWRVSGEQLVDGVNAGGDALTMNGVTIRAATDVRTGTANETNTAQTPIAGIDPDIPTDMLDEYDFLGSGSWSYTIPKPAGADQVTIRHILRSGGSSSSADVQTNGVLLNTIDITNPFEADIFGDADPDGGTLGANRTRTRDQVIDVSGVNDIIVTITQNSGTARYGGFLVYTAITEDPDPPAPTYDAQYTLQAVQSGGVEKIRIMYDTAANLGLTADTTVVHENVSYDLIGVDFSGAEAKLVFNSLTTLYFQGWYSNALRDFRTAVGQAINDGLTDGEINVEVSAALA